MSGLVMVEGLPGTGKSTLAAGVAQRLSAAGVPAEHWGEGRFDHPVDLEQVAVLTNDDLVRLLTELPAAGPALIAAAERAGDAWLVRHALRPDLPADLVARLRAHDGYDGAVTPALHGAVLTDSWRRFGRQDAPTAVQVWECVLLQNPACAFLARFDEPASVLEAHVRGLVDAVADHRPVLVYLDGGDPAPVLERAAAERPAEWLASVVDYHCGQGYGLARGLSGFDGYVEVLRHRREVELDLLPRLDLPVLVVHADDGGWDERAERVDAFVTSHLPLQADPERAA